MENRDYSAQIRIMTPADVAAVARIESQAPSAAWGEQTFLDCLLLAYDAWVLESADQIAGYIVFSRDDDAAHVLTLGVDEAQQRRGVGAALVRHLIASCAGLPEIWLEVRESNAPAISLYRQLGFEVINKRANYYRDSGEDAVVMCLKLT